MAQRPATLVLLEENVKLALASEGALRESYERARRVLDSGKADLDVAERETLEALTARFARFSDFLTQRLFRTLDEHELTSEGTLLDRLGRFEKRGIIASVASFRAIREIHNAIAHEYLIEKSDRVVRESIDHAPELFLALQRFREYVAAKGYLPGSGAGEEGP